MVSCPAWDGCVSYRQETIRVWFPIRLGTAVLHTDRKLFAYGFLFGLRQMCFIPTGNYLRRFSYSAWHCCVSHRQETICVWFPVRLGTDVFHTSRKLFAYGFLSGLAPMCFIPTGNCLRMVSYPIWHQCVSYRQETVPLSHYLTSPPAPYPNNSSGRILFFPSSMVKTEARSFFE